MKNKILLGTDNNGDKIFLSKHSWDCDWYWGLGYLGNDDMHFHFNSFLKDSKYCHEIFKKTTISDDAWWVIRDLFVQAYALKKVADVYRHGGYQSSKSGVTNCIQSKYKENETNNDLKKVLDVIWAFAQKVTTEGGRYES